MNRLKPQSGPEVRVVRPKEDLTGLMEEIYKMTDPKTDNDVQRSAENTLKKISSLMQAYGSTPDTLEKIKNMKALRELVSEIRMAVHKIDQIRSVGDFLNDALLHEAVIDYLDQTLVETDEELKLNFFTE
jgi:hypothetical protein